MSSGRMTQDSGFRKLYQIERKLADADPEARYQTRQSESVPLLKKFRAWLDEALTHVAPKGVLGEALQVAALLGVTKGRVSQLHAKAIERIRAWLNTGPRSIGPCDRRERLYFPHDRPLA